MWFDSSNTKASLSGFWRQQWRHDWAGFKCQESKDASKNAPHQHKVSSFQQQGSRWHYHHSSCLNRRHACRNPKQDLQQRDSHQVAQAIDGLVTKGLCQASEVVKDNLQGWSLPLQVILYLSFRPFVNQRFLWVPFRFSLSDWVTLRFASG